MAGSSGHTTQPAPTRTLTAKQENRLNEAAKIRVAEVLGLKRSMIDLTDDEPPSKVARVENSSRATGMHSWLKRAVASPPLAIKHESPRLDRPVLALAGPTDPRLGQESTQKAQTPNPIASSAQVEKSPLATERMRLIANCISTMSLVELQVTLAYVCLYDREYFDRLHQRRVGNRMDVRVAENIYHCLLEASIHDAVQSKNEHTNPNTAPARHVGNTLHGTRTQLAAHTTTHVEANPQPVPPTHFQRDSQPQTSITPKPGFRAPPGLRQAEQADPSNDLSHMSEATS